MKKEEKPFFWKREILSWVLVIGIAYLAAKGLKEFVIYKFEVISGSMETTLMVDDCGIGLQCAYLFSDPDRFDIVIFPFPDDPTQTYIKRVIGLPGETVEGRDGVIYIDGNELKEGNYYHGKLLGDFGPYTVPEESYFVMGDNREISIDARYWDNKFVKKKDIIAKALFVYKPKLDWVG